MAARAIRHPGGSYIPGRVLPPPEPVLARRAGGCPGERIAGWSPAGRSGGERFPFNNFTCCLTLFPKCFSSFDHSTCALSVSGRYLALDGIYHPFGAAFPNNSTRRRGFTGARPPAADGVLTLCDVPFQGTWTGAAPEAPSPNYNSGPGAGSDFKFELLPLHSPLLRQSRLVSCPPLIDMLKFSGYPCLIRGQPVASSGGPGGPAGRTLRPRGAAIAREVAPGPPLPFGPVPPGGRRPNTEPARARGVQ